MCLDYVGPVGLVGLEGVEERGLDSGGRVEGG